MPQSMFCVTINTVGALASSPVYTFKFPFDVQLIFASAENSSANAGTLKIGDSADDDGYLAATNFGVSGAPAIVDEYDEWDGAEADNQFPHIAANTAIKVTVTDHASHMADVCVILGFTIG